MFADSSHKSEFLCLYCILILATFWVTEALPPAVTSMLPIFMFPALGILDTELTCMCYFRETTMMFVGSLIVAITIEYSGLHVRFALKCLLLIGSSHRRLSAGLFLVTMFISMWITNTAATAMMAPIVTAILQTLEEEGMCKYFRTSPESVPATIPKPSRTTLCYFLGIAYSASIGGTGTYVGTGTNLSARDQIEKFFPNSLPAFHRWMAVAIPPMLVDIGCLWVWMNFLFLGLLWKGGCDPEIRETLLESKQRRREMEKTIRKVIEEKYAALGPIRWNEVLTGLVFVLCVFLWLLRAPQVIPGWADRIVDLSYMNDPSLPQKNNTVLKKKYRMKDAGAAFFVDLLLFTLPGTPLFLHFCNPKANKVPGSKGPALVVWEVVQQRMPWGLIFVIGCGFAIAEASSVSGMSSMIGSYLAALRHVPQFWIVFICCFMATNITEFTSNVAVLNILGPVIGSMGLELDMNGAYLFVPVAICCSFSFMLPVGTPPNAVVAGMANIRTEDMIIAGTGPTVFTLISTTVFVHLLSGPLFTEHNVS
ncbi:protein I'm not dead yet-like [Periplaneta americana]|uniref:protein I'm not dead yet-like n=1 Tax=Periplaneta americana TaxID=6978 RepID=UPI0037E8D80B